MMLANTSRRVRAAVVVWKRVWDTTALYNGRHYLRRARWTTSAWRRLGYGRWYGS